MTRRKHNKRALFLSCLSLLLCVSMLIGGTFAWFTDSASTGVNKITAGNLDVKLYYNTDCGTTWNDAEKAENIFTSKWEPGHSQVVYFKVENAGSLVLDYKVATNIVKETEGTNQAGAAFKLSDYLQFGCVDVTAAFEDRTAARAAITTPHKFSAVGTGETRLQANTSQIIAFVVWMPEETGNVANHNGTNVPEIQFGINVIASQANAEKDSFDENYDEDASFPEAPELDAIVAKVGTAADLKELLDTAVATETSVNVTLTTDIDINNQWEAYSVSTTWEEKTIVIDGGGHTIKNLNTPLISALGSYNSIKIEFKNLTIADSNIIGDDSNYATGAFLNQIGGNTVVSFENCHLKTSTVNGGSDEHVGGLVGYVSAPTFSMTNCSVENCTITGAKSVGGVIGFDSTATTLDKITVTDSKITSTGLDDGKKYSGTVVGTSNAYASTYTNVTTSGNTINDESSETYYGRAFVGLSINGTEYVQ